MEQHGDEIHFETDEARGGATTNVMRWVLGVSVLLAIVLLSAIWITGALSHKDYPSSAQTQAETTLEQDAAGDTDGVLIDGGDNAESLGSETETVDGVGLIEN